ncbi:MAG: Uncharacterised protein [Prochlorococcus marinus str. MIT 9215]|nr:MAG: Uncharacterised protein [Prochlorococcus marinus str. MIT 9215]
MKPCFDHLHFSGSSAFLLIPENIDIRKDNGDLVATATE